MLYICKTLLSKVTFSEFKANVLLVCVPWNGTVGTFQQRKRSNASNREETYGRAVSTKKSVAEE